MYDVDEKDRVREIEDLPQSSVGAPMPLVLSDEHSTVLAYYVQERDPDWDGRTVRIVDPVTASEPLALVTFTHCYALLFGPPNDEAFAGHPLASRGLHPYGAFEVKPSSWVRRLERMNAVHPCHRPAEFWKRRHIVMAFHDTSFECVCDSYHVEMRRGSLAQFVPSMMGLLGWRPDNPPTQPTGSAGG